MLAGTRAMAARAIRISRYWTGPICLDLEPFVRFDFPIIGHVNDINGQPLMEMATEHRWISRYEDIPPVVSGAILAAEDKNSRIPQATISTVREGLCFYVDTTSFNHRKNRHCAPGVPSG
jgi:hypothetical protein